MFSAVGWICVQEAEYRDQFGDLCSEPREATLEVVRAAMERLVPASEPFPAPTAPHRLHSGPAVLFRSHNGTVTVLIDTHPNHRREWTISLFSEIARIAPGSFGYLYVWDDEHPDEAEKIM